MADSSDSDGTHRVQTKQYHRTPTGETFEQGDLITPTEGELNAFGDRFAPVSSDSRAVPPASAGDDASHTPAETTEDTEPSEGVLPGDADTPHDLTPEQLAELPYNDLRSIAGETQGVSGNLPAEDMRRGIADVYGIDYPLMADEDESTDTSTDTDTDTDGGE